MYSTYYERSVDMYGSTEGYTVREFLKLEKSTICTACELNGVCTN